MNKAKKTLAQKPLVDKKLKRFPTRTPEQIVRDPLYQAALYDKIRGLCGLAVGIWYANNHK